LAQGQRAPAGPPPWRRALAALLCLTGSGLGGCRPTGGAAPISRTLGGQTRVGAFVPPFAYEAYVRGEAALARGAFEEAAAQFELAGAAPEEDPYVLARLAYAEARAGRPRDAERSLEHALALDPCSEAAWLTRAELAELAATREQNQAKLELALQAYRRAGACAPRSLRGPLGEARVLEQMGRTSEALLALARFEGAADQPTAARAAFEAALRGTDPATLAHALETWTAYQAADAESVERACRWALAHGAPALAARLRDQHPGTLPRSLDAAIARELGELPRLRLLVEGPAEELGGQRAAAELALVAGAYERAELEATAALAATPGEPALLALRAEARAALGQLELSLQDLRAIDDAALRRRAALAVLARSGQPALAGELAALAQ
jgi:hypothetical protein